jgi:predicted phosphodiesterase
MRLAVISDIHGNSAALDAVLADIARRGADLTVNLGDSLSGPLDARGTADRLLSLGLPTVLGNHDRALIDRPPERMGSWEAPVFPALAPAHLDWLRGLPATRMVEGLLLCHGTPASDLDLWLDWPGPEGRLVPADAARVEAAAAGHTTAAGFLCGHTHLPRALRLADGRPVVNPGSVGLPAWADRRDPARVMRAETGSPDARYALLDHTSAGWVTALIAVPYDPSPMVALARAAGADDWVAALTSGRVP